MIVKLRDLDALEARMQANGYRLDYDAKDEMLHVIAELRAARRALGNDVSKLVAEANEILSSKRCLAKNGKHPPVWHEIEIQWRCGECGVVLDPYDYGCVTR